jgi:hypothetical protein
MVTMKSTDPPKKIILFDEVHEGYWTGDCECACFNSISTGNEVKSREESNKWHNACTYIQLSGLDASKKYRVTLHVEAEEIE